MSAPAYSLTSQQQQALAYLEARRPVAPSRREIAAELGVGLNRVTSLLRALQERGHIHIMPGLERGIDLLRPGRPRSHRLSRAEGIAYARAWHIRTRPYFDGLYGPETA